MRNSVRYYLRVFRSFILLSILISALPALAVSVLSETSHVSHVAGFYVEFANSPQPRVQYLRAGEELNVGFSGIIVGNGTTMRSIVETLSSSRIQGRLYFPVLIGGKLFLLPYGTRMTDTCKVLAGKVPPQSISITGYVEIMSSGGASIRRFQLPPCSFKEYAYSNQALKAFSSTLYAAGTPVYIPSREVYGAIMNMSERGNIEISGFLLIPNRSVSPEDVYSSVLAVARKHGLYPKVYVLTSRWIHGNGRKEWKTLLWEYFILLLPMLPVIFVLMRNEEENERKLRLIVKSFGGNPLMIDLLVAVVIGLTSLVAFLWLEPAYGAIVLSFLLMLYVFRYGLRSVRVSETRFLAVLTVLYSSLFLIVELGTRCRVWVANLLSLPFGFDHALKNLMFITMFHYSPIFFGGLALSAGLLLYLSIRGSPPRKALARSMAMSFIVLSTVTLYSGVVYASPITGIYSVSDVGYGATIYVELNVSSPNVMEAYDAVVGNVSEEGGEYGTIWYLGLLEKGGNETSTVVGTVMGYGKSLADFLRSAEWRSDQARELYGAIKTGRAVIPEGSAAQTSGGFIRGTVVSDDSIVNIRMKYKRIDTLLPSYLGAVFVPKGSGNFKAVPKYVLVYGGKNVYSALMSVERRYGDVVQVSSLMNGSREIVSGLGAEALPVISAAILLLTSVVLGFRDRWKMRTLEKLTMSRGMRMRAYTLISLSALLPLSLVMVRPLVDTIGLLRMELVGRTFTVMLLPILALLVVPLVYVLTMLRTTGGVWDD